MKLDATDLRYILPEEFRVLKAVEQGCRAHHVVPASVIAQLSGLQHSGLNKLMGSLAKRNLIAREQNIKYDGYRLTYGGYDFLAVRALKEKDHVEAVGHRIGVGKESDIYVVSAGLPDHEIRVLKIHRLGRISFRAVKEKRDYTSKTAARQNFSWMYLSRLAAAKEYQFMQVLHEHGFPVPTPIAQSRHTVLMSLIDAYPLRQVAELPADQIPLLYSALMQLILRLARAGLIHGDFNEFNLLIRERKQPGDDEYDDQGQSSNVVFPRMDPSYGPFGQRVGTSPPPELKEGERLEQSQNVARVIAPQTSAAESSQSDDDEDGQSDAGSEASSSSSASTSPSIHLSDGSEIEPILIDFPQMVSVLHSNAEYYFNRDVQCVRRFFRKRFRFVSEEWPKFSDAVGAEWEGERREREKRREKRKAAAAATTTTPAADAEVDDDDDDDADLKEYLDLDVITKASGWAKLEKKRGEAEELDQYLSRMRMDGDGGESGEEGLPEDDEEGMDDEEEEEEDQEEQKADEVEKTEDLAPPSEEAPEGQPRLSRRPKPSKKPATTEPPPSRHPALKNGQDSRAVALQIALEREQTRKLQLRHHGKKQQQGKTGRSHAGGKAKDASAVKDSGVF